MQLDVTPLFKFAWSYKLAQHGLLSPIFATCNVLVIAAK